MIYLPHQLCPRATGVKFPDSSPMVLGWAFTRVGRRIGQGRGSNRPAKPLRQTRQDAAPGTADGLAPDGHISQGSAFAARGCRVAPRADWQRHSAVRTDPVRPHIACRDLARAVRLRTADGARRRARSARGAGRRPGWRRAAVHRRARSAAGVNVGGTCRGQRLRPRQGIPWLAQARHDGSSCWLPDVWTAVSTPAVRSRRPPASRRSAVPAGLATDCGSTGAARCRRRCAGNGPPRHGSLPHG